MSLTCFCASVSSTSLIYNFLYRFCFCFPSSPKPLFLDGWLLNGGSALPPTTATTTAVRWQEPLLLVAGHVPHGRHHQTSCRRHCSSEHTPRLGFWSLLLVTGHVPHTRNLPTTCGDTALRSTLLVSAFGRISFMLDVSHRPLRSGTAQAPPIRLFAPRLASILHCTSSRGSSTSSQIARRPLLFFRAFGAEAYARRATDKHTRIDTPKDHRRGLRLFREPISLHTLLLTEPDRPSREPL